MSDNSISTALKLMPYGFYSITSRHEDDANAMVANWITQASFEPQLVAIGLQKTSYSHGLIKKSGVFAINIFKAEDEEAIKPFTKGRAKNPDKMRDAAYRPAAETGCPVLEGAAAYIEFKVVNLVDVGGDHDILVGRAIGAELLKESTVSETLNLVQVGWSYAG